jgi:hypothetical protein
MSDFRVWGRIEHLGQDNFFVIASGVPESKSECATILTMTAHSLAEAQQEMARLIAEVGRTVRIRSDGSWTS